MRMFLPKLLLTQTPHISPGMIASDSRSRKVGMEFPSRFRILGIDFFIPFPFLNFGNVFFIPFPFPNFGNRFFSFPSRSQIVGMDFFQSFPFPSFGNRFFQFLSRSLTSGMELSIPVLIPELRNVIPAHPCQGHLSYDNHQGQDGHHGQGQTGHVILIFQVTCIWQLLQFLRCFNHLLFLKKRVF